MKILIDAHLPKSISRCFKDCYVIHTSSLMNQNNTTDQEINELSLLKERIVITKDDGFKHSFNTLCQPFKLILVKLGNSRIKDVISYFQKNNQKIKELITEHSFLILEPEEIRIIK